MWRVYAESFDSHAQTELITNKLALSKYNRHIGAFQSLDGNLQKSSEIEKISLPIEYFKVLNRKVTQISQFDLSLV